MFPRASMRARLAASHPCLRGERERRETHRREKPSRPRAVLGCASAPRQRHRDPRCPASRREEKSPSMRQTRAWAPTSPGGGWRRPRGPLGRPGVGWPLGGDRGRRAARGAGARPPRAQFWPGRRQPGRRSAPRWPGGPRRGRAVGRTWLRWGRQGMTSGRGGGRAPAPPPPLGLGRWRLMRARPVAPDRRGRGTAPGRGRGPDLSGVLLFDVYV